MSSSSGREIGATTARRLGRRTIRPSEARARSASLIGIALIPSCSLSTAIDATVPGAMRPSRIARRISTVACSTVEVRWAAGIICRSPFSAVMRIDLTERARGRPPGSVPDRIARVGPGCDVLDQGRPRRDPAQELAGQIARGGDVGTDEPAEEAEPVRLLRVQRAGRQPELLAERRGDRAERQALLADRVEDRAAGAALEEVDEQPGRVAAVDGGPAVLTVAQVTRDAAGPGGRGDHRDEAVVADPVH